MNQESPETFNSRDWDNIEEWIEGHIGSSTIPDFKKNSENYILLSYCKNITETIGNLSYSYSKLLENETTELEKASTELGKYLEFIGNRSSLETLEFSQQLFQLSKIAYDLGLNQISLSNILAAQSNRVFEEYLNFEKNNQIEERIDELDRKISQSKRRTQQYKEIERAKSRTEAKEKSQIYEWNKSSTLLNEKVVEYSARLEKTLRYFKEKRINTPNFSEIKESINRVRELYESVKEQENKLFAYANLPPDIQLAEIKLKELIQYYEKLLKQRNQVFAAALNDEMETQ